MSIEIAISILMSNSLVISAWWVGVLIKKNSEIEENIES
jgi:hypothetical protein